MISEELKMIVDKFNKQGKMNFLKATTEEKIASFEKENKITLPAIYKEWLQISDGGELFLPAGVQLYGIEDQVRSMLLLVHLLQEIQFYQKRQKKLFLYTIRNLEELMKNWYTRTL